MEHKTNWKLKDTVTPDDMNRIEENNSELESPSFDDSGTVEGISGFTDFLNSVKTKMNIFQFYRDFKAGMKYVLHTGKLVNNVTTTEEGFALDGRVGKYLQDQITEQNKNLDGLNFKNPFRKAENNTASSGAFVSFNWDGKNVVTYVNNLLLGNLVTNSDIDLYKIIEAPETITTLMKKVDRNSRFFVRHPYFPDDLPIQNIEGFIDIKVEPDMRKTVIFYRYASPSCEIYQRDWNTNGWIYEWQKFITNRDINGFVPRKIEFLTDGSIKETSGTSVKMTEFLENGNIKETLTDGEKSIIKVTKFLPDGSIEETIEQGGE